MVSLDKKVFGQITLKEIIGAVPPIEELKRSLDSQFNLLQKDLDSKSPDELKELLESQTELERETNSRPGSMALDQYKIRLMMDYSQKYISEIKKRLN